MANNGIAAKEAGQRAWASLPLLIDEVKAEKDLSNAEELILVNKALNELKKRYKGK